MKKYKKTPCKAVSCVSHFRQCRACPWRLWKYEGKKEFVRKFYDKRLKDVMKLYHAEV